jgi:hypothetical protein
MQCSIVKSPGGHSAHPGTIGWHQQTGPQAGEHDDARTLSGVAVLGVVVLEYDGIPLTVRRSSDQKVPPHVGADVGCDIDGCALAILAAEVYYA